MCVEQAQSTDVAVNGDRLSPSPQISKNPFPFAPSTATPLRPGAAGPSRTSAYAHLFPPESSSPSIGVSTGPSAKRKALGSHAAAAAPLPVDGNLFRSDSDLTLMLHSGVEALVTRATEILLNRWPQETPAPTKGQDNRDKE